MCGGYFGYPQHHNSSSFAAVEGYEFLCVKETRNGKKPGAWCGAASWIFQDGGLLQFAHGRQHETAIFAKSTFQIFPDLSRSFQIIHFKISHHCPPHLFPICFQLNFRSTSAEVLRTSAKVAGIQVPKQPHAVPCGEWGLWSWIFLDAVKLKIFIIPRFVKYFTRVELRFTLSPWIHDSSRLSCKCTKVKPEPLEKCKSLCFMHWHTSEITTVGSDLVSASTGWQRETPDVAWLIGCSVEA